MPEDPWKNPIGSAVVATVLEGFAPMLKGEPKTSFACQSPDTNAARNVNTSSSAVGSCMNDQDLEVLRRPHIKKELVEVERAMWTKYREAMEGNGELGMYQKLGLTESCATCYIKKMECQVRCLGSLTKGNQVSFTRNNLRCNIESAKCTGIPMDPPKMKPRWAPRQAGQPANGKEAAYAFVVKYVVLDVGVEISHTSLVVCDKADVEEETEKFERWCGDGGMFGCWKSSSWIGNFTSDVEAILQTRLAASSNCSEYDFENGGRIMESSFGTGETYKRFSDAMDVYPVGQVLRSKVSEALIVAVSCAHLEIGEQQYQLDFNKGTYHFLKHNCHSFVNAMLLLLQLPYWQPDGGLPAEFVPEDPHKNPIQAKAIASLLSKLPEPQAKEPGRSKECPSAPEPDSSAI
jgi:hypothetical protein